jgi:hypothetical protein
MAHSIFLSLARWLRLHLRTYVQVSRSDFANATFVPNAVVRARIVLNLQNLAALKDTLNGFIQTASTSETPAPATGGATKH